MRVRLRNGEILTGFFDAVSSDASTLYLADRSLVARAIVRAINRQDIACEEFLGPLDAGGAGNG